MSEIKTIIFHAQRNEAHLEFLTTFRTRLDDYPEVKQLVVEALLTKFDADLERERALVDIERKSPLTALIAGADRRTDNAITAISGVVNVNLHHFNPANVAAAKLIYDRLRSFGNIRDKPYEEETVAVRILVGDLYVKFKDEIALLSLTPWVNELEAANQLFAQLLEDRNSELAARPQENIIDVHRDTEADYHKMITVFEADINVNGDAKCGEFVRKLNEQIKYFNEHAHHPPVKKDIKHADAAPVEVQTYTGVEITPLPEVFFVEEGQPTKKLRFTVDYDLTYKDNVNAGDAEIIIHGKGAYKGKKTVTFNIARTV
ncbi:MAG: DUF6261 family protein [Tannerella sp.]|jgi:hypothetical protein|nr:DUF6261 family protein [Tannerella sp.]